MQCKFLDHGIAVSYDHVVKPCCEFEYDADWARQNHIDQIDITTWHQSSQVIKIRNELDAGTWPKQCRRCANLESQGRQDSIRGNANNAYANYTGQDITLEIRPGSVCNFGCQTCWPEASSRVAQFYQQAGIINIQSLNTSSISNFDFLLPIAGRIRNLVLLGGEPFYDPNCQKFLAWAKQNLQATVNIFTNGSHVDWDWVNNYTGNITMTFSIDAVGKPAEYIRFGTDWSVVYDNFVRAQHHPKIILQVNVTVSIYNYHLIEDIIDMLIPNWPSVVNFGRPNEPYLGEASVPDINRLELIKSLENCVKKLFKSNIALDQQYNTIKAIKSIIDNFRKIPFDPERFEQIKQFIKSMDQVKRLNIRDSASPVDFEKHYQYFSDHSTPE